MATISLRCATTPDRMAYPNVRRAQSHITQYNHFGNGDLAQYLERDSFATIADRQAAKFFGKSADLAIAVMVRTIYVILLIVAPILQRLPLSAKIDWHRGHLISWFRLNSNERRRRYHFRVREIARDYQPDLLSANLGQCGIHDAAMVEAILDLYRRHCNGTGLKDILAHQIFDPILLMTAKEGFELRFGNHLYRLDKEPFDGSTDVRRESVRILDYALTSKEHKTGRHMEITIAYDVLQNFRQSVKTVLSLSANPEFKLKCIERHIRDLVERTRPARSALPQILELRQWMSTKLAPLAGTVPEAKLLPALLVNLWLQRNDPRLHLKAPSFFFDPKKYDEKTFNKLFSPYREV